LPEYQASIVSPWTLVIFSVQRSEAKTLPSRITYGTASATSELFAPLPETPPMRR